MEVHTCLSGVETLLLIFCSNHDSLNVWDTSMYAGLHVINNEFLGMHNSFAMSLFSNLGYLRQYLNNCTESM